MNDSICDELLHGVTLLKSPRDWQIMQRDQQGNATIELSGTWRTKESRFSIQARVVDESTQAPVTHDLDWQDAVLDEQANVFQITLKDIPQGGLYRVETRLRRPFANDRRAMRGDCIHHLGVGDLYVIAGQSNASGSGKGTILDGPLLGVHQLGNDQQWKLASHPLEDATRSKHPLTVTGVFHGHSPWLAFGRSLYNRTRIPIGLLPTAYGGSPISRWIMEDRRPGELFQNMNRMLEVSGSSGFAGLLWYQGEHEACSDKVEGYADSFRELVLAIRNETNKHDLPVFVGQLNRLNGVESNVHMQGDWSRLREIQRRLAYELDCVYLIPTIDSALSDGIHNSATANMAIGEKFAAAALEHLYRLPVFSGYPTPVSVIYKDENRSCIALMVEGLSGDWTPVKLIQDFTVEDDIGFVPIRDISVDEFNTISIHMFRSTEGQAVLHNLYGTDPIITLRDDQCRCMVPFSLVVPYSKHICE